MDKMGIHDMLTIIGQHDKELEEQYRDEWVVYQRDIENFKKVIQKETDPQKIKRMQNFLDTTSEFLRETELRIIDLSYQIQGKTKKNTLQKKLGELIQEECDLEREIEILLEQRNEIDTQIERIRQKKRDIMINQSETKAMIHAFSKKEEC